jgi:hypothetical protein
VLERRDEFASNPAFGSETNLLRFDASGPNSDAAESARAESFHAENDEASARLAGLKLAQKLTFSAGLASRQIDLRWPVANAI